MSILRIKNELSLSAAALTGLKKSINGKKLTHCRVSILRIINELSLSAAALNGQKKWQNYGN
jgi:hypothetical protein